MAKIGYIMAAAHYDKLEEDWQWMQEYGCVKIVEENDAAGHPIDDIWKASGFHSRSFVFRILNKYNIKLNRGKHSGLIKKKGERKDNQDSKGDDNQ